MKFLAFAASHRPESLNKKLVLLAAKQMRSLNMEVEHVEYSRFDMGIYNDTLTDNPPEEALSFSKKIADVDGIIIAMPEYNWSFPGSLKNIIDWTSIINPNPMAGKTVLLMSATTSARGGIIGLQQLKLPLESQNMFVFNKVFPLAHAQNSFTESGELIDKVQESLFSIIIKGYISFTEKFS
ncbi:MAG: NAD(P)H-dependent oxidoreductase [Rickettsiales bacterium]|jgi:chromate reductase